LVVTDQRMPHMTGDELLARMTGAQAVGIMVSGFADLPAVISRDQRGQSLRVRDQAVERRRPALQSRQGRRALSARRQNRATKRQLLADLMNSSPDGIFFKDKTLAIQRANRSFAQVLGVASPDELIGSEIERRTSAGRAGRAHRGRGTGAGSG